MKKLKIFLIIIIIIILPICLDSHFLIANAVVAGDINGDGKADFTDAQLIFDYINGTKTLTSSQKSIADLNCDGEVNIADATIFFHCINGLLSTLTAAGKTTGNLSITKLPDKTDYIEGETFNEKGLVVEIIHETGYREKISDYLISSSTSGSKGIKIITVSVMEMKTAFIINIMPKKISNLIITKLPLITEYSLGQPFDLSGLIVTAFYSDGTYGEINDYSIDGYDDNEGIKTIRIFAMQQSVTFEVTVKAFTEYTAYVSISGNNLRIRSLPSFEGSEIGLFANGTKIIITGTLIGEWYPVRGITNEGIEMCGYCHISGIN